MRVRSTRVTATLICALALALSATGVEGASAASAVNLLDAAHVQIQGVDEADGAGSPSARRAT